MADLMRRMDKMFVPLTWSETLNLTVQEMPSELAGTIGSEDPKQYVSATINSFPYGQNTVSSRYLRSFQPAKGSGLDSGYCRRIKAGPLNRRDGVLGMEPSTLHATVHTNIPSRNMEHGKATDTRLDLSAAFHEYAVD
jgi:hypothetical protein